MVKDVSSILTSSKPFISLGIIWPSLCESYLRFLGYTSLRHWAAGLERVKVIYSHEVPTPTRNLATEDESEGSKPRNSIYAVKLLPYKPSVEFSDTYLH